MVEPHGLEVAADWQTLQSPETYVGYGQSTGFASGRCREPSTSPRLYTAPGPLRLNQWDSRGTGRWPGTPQSRTSPADESPSNSTRRDLNLVMGPTSEGSPSPFGSSSTVSSRKMLGGATWILDDVSRSGDQRTYQLIRQLGAIADRLFEIEFLDAGVEAYCFTFG